MKKIIKYVISFMMLVALTLLIDTKEVYAETLCKGVFVEDLDLGGKSVEEATQLVNQYLEDIITRKVIVKANDKEVSTDIKSLGATFREADYVDQACNIGKVGNIVQRYKDLKDVENDKKVYKVEVDLDDTALTDFVNNKAVECNIEAKEPSMVPKGGRVSEGNVAASFTYTEGVEGKEINNEDVKKDILAKFDKWDKKDVVIEAKTKVTKPKYSMEDLKKCDSKLATFTTYYGSSASGRSGNIANAARKINGTVLHIGQTFSMLNTITPFTTANGYAPAGSYAQGKVVESIGGGVCQVSSTLYNAVLRAELEIVKRNNHSMIVTYVPISGDAMISDGSSDFKFKNNSDAPVYIEGYTVGKSVTFNIYGHETRPASRTLKFENKILSKIQPGKDVVTQDKTKPKSYRKVTQSAHIGYRAEYYKIVYENGVEKQRIKINSSYYKASPNYITVGAMEEKKATVAPTQPAQAPAQMPAAPVEQPVQTPPTEVAPPVTDTTNTQVVVPNQ